MNRLRFWNREAPFWPSFEKKLIQEYSRIRPNSIVTVRGYANAIGSTGNMFALTPTQYTNQVYLFCKNMTDTKPNQNEYIEVEGYTRRHIIRPTYYRKKMRLSFDSEIILHVEHWLDAKPDFCYYSDPHEFFGLSSDFTLKDYKRDILFSIKGLEPKIEDFLVLSTLSAPSFGIEKWQTGGINLTLYDSTQSGLSRIVLSELKKAVPLDVNRIYPVETAFGRFGMKHNFSFLADSADKTLSPTVENVLTRSGVSRNDEMSLGLFSKSCQPNSFEDKPCAFSDVVTVIPETTDILRKKKIETDPETVKYMLTHQMLRPEIKGDTIMSDIGTKIEKIRESFGLDPIQLTQFGFLNANNSARPSQILRQALSFGRSHNRGVIDSHDVERVFEDYFAWNFEYVYEIWEDLFRKGKNRPPDRPEFGKIRRIIRKYDQGDGVKESIIIDESRVKPKQTLAMLGDMHSEGRIYEKTIRNWRLTYG